MRKKITVALTGAFFLGLSAFLWPSNRTLTASHPINGGIWETLCSAIPFPKSWKYSGSLPGY